MRFILVAIVAAAALTVIAAGQSKSAQAANAVGYHKHISERCEQGRDCFLIPPPPPPKPANMQVIDWGVMTSEIVGSADSSPRTECDQHGSATPWWCAMGMARPSDNGQDRGNDSNAGNNRSGSNAIAPSDRSTSNVSRSAPSSRSRSSAARSGPSARSTSAPSSTPSSSPSLSSRGGPDCRR